MAKPHTIDEPVIRQQIDTLAEAIRSMDIETVMSI
jgi:hypothetical protein